MRALAIALAVVLIAGCAEKPHPTAPVKGTAPEEAPQQEQWKAEPHPSGDPPTSLDPEPQVKVWAVDLTGGREPELLLDRKEPLTLLRASPDGRYLLFQRDDDTQRGSPPGPLFVWDRQAGTWKEGPAVEVHPDHVAWNGSGWWVHWLERVDLELNLDRYEAVRQQLSLGSKRRLIFSSFSADGRRVALLVHDEEREPGLSVDLVLAQSDGNEVKVIPRVIQPWFGKSGFFAYLSLSPDGTRLLLRSASPGDAIIDTAQPERERWKPLIGEFVGPQPFPQGGGGPSMPWTPDSKYSVHPFAGIIDREGIPLSGRINSWVFLWNGQGTGLLSTSHEEWQVVTTRGKVLQRLASPPKGRPVGFLPDGRVLSGWTIYRN